jgi:tRNA1(Val) A37 N6-methylase TrmN6
VIDRYELTHDGFLDNRLTVAQPKKGFRAGHDSVLLAACIEAKDNSNLVELGSGVGVASLCLAQREKRCRVLGIEVDPELVALANDNARLNGMSERVSFLTGDVLEHDFQGGLFDQVFLNPPFHTSDGRKSPDPRRARAMYDANDALHAWTERAVELVRPGGKVTIVMRADRLPHWRARVSGAVIVLPLLPKPDGTAKRVIARLSPRGPSSYTEMEPLVLHNRDGLPTEEAEAVLRHGAPLYLE